MSEQTIAFVVGGTGRLGTRIVESPAPARYGVRALVRPSTAKDRRATLAALADTNDNLEIVQGDVLDPVDQLARAVEGAEVVVSMVQAGRRWSSTARSTSSAPRSRLACRG